MDHFDEWALWFVAAVCGVIRANEDANGLRDPQDGGIGKLIVLAMVAGIALDRSSSFHGFVREFASLIGVYKIAKLIADPLLALRYFRRRPPTP